MSGAGRTSARPLRGGFTLIELLITLLLLGFLLAGVWSVFQTQSRGIASQDQMVEVHNNLRVGMWDVGFDLMHAGLGRVYTVDPSSGTCRDLGVLDANPYQVVFLYDVNDSSGTGGGADGPAFTWDNGAGNATICASSSCSGTCSTTPNVAGAGNPQLHSEIVRLTLDGSGNAVTGAAGTVRTIAFSAANSQAWRANIAWGEDADTASANPNDYSLWKEVISRNAAPATYFQPLAYGIRGPDASNAPPTDETGASIALFTYFLDSNFDGVWQCGTDVLKGDADGNCALSAAEIVTLTTTNAGVLTPAELFQVLRVGVQLRAEAQRADPLYGENGGYRFRVLRSSSRLNNMAFPP